MSKSVFFYEELIKKLEPLAHDFSHITKKLLQTINYLTTDMYTVGDNNYNLEFLEQEMEEKGMRMRFKGIISSLNRIYSHRQFLILI